MMYELRGSPEFFFYVYNPKQRSQLGFAFYQAKEICLDPSSIDNKYIQKPGGGNKGRCSCSCSRELPILEVLGIRPSVTASSPLATPLKTLIAFVVFLPVPWS